jgi:AcrR family transcriptional regulator
MVAMKAAEGADSVDSVGADSAGPGEPMSVSASAPAPMRQRIIAAALEVIDEGGIAAATTKQIARVAKVSEGSLYNHFANKTELIGATMAELTAGIRGAMAELLGQIGQGSIEDNLTRMAEATIAFYRRLLPITGPVYGDHDMLVQIRRDMPEQGLGPLRGHQALIGYFTAEQNNGRLPSIGRPAYLTALLLGACQQYALLTMLVDSEQVESNAGLPADPGAYARQVVRTLLQSTEDDSDTVRQESSAHSE